MSSYLVALLSKKTNITYFKYESRYKLYVRHRTSWIVTRLYFCNDHWNTNPLLIEETGKEKPTIKAYAHRKSAKDSEVKYEVDFTIPPDFGMIGAVLVENEHHKEIYLKKMVFDGLPQGQINVTCGSYIHSKFDNPEKRVFFTNKASYHSPFLYISCDNFLQMVSFTKFCSIYWYFHTTLVIFIPMWKRTFNYILTCQYLDTFRLIWYDKTISDSTHTKKILILKGTFNYLLYDNV